MGPSSQCRRRFVGLGLLIGGVVALAIGAFLMRSKKNAVPISVWLLSAPYSFDPLEYDSFIHHFVARPVLASLVSQYKVGAFVGVLVKEWTNNPDMTEWRFELREGMRFQNGDPITPLVIERSLVRIAWLQHSRGSQSGLTESLLGVESLKSAAGQIPGVSVRGMDLVLRFKKPQPKLLENLSFGIYAIVHPKDYDPVTGAWRDPKAAIASGPYEIKSWGSSEVKIALRPDFPSDLRHPLAAQEVGFVWDKDSRLAADLAMGADLDDRDFSDRDFTASGSTNISIYYIHLFAWKTNSALSNVETRRYLRTKFYAALTRKGIKHVRSFLPTTLPGIAQFNDDSVASVKNSTRFTVRGVSSEDGGFFRKAVVAAVIDAVQVCGGNYEIVDKPEGTAFYEHYSPDLSRYVLEIHPLLTGILVEDPIGDVKFMVKSKEGIMLPDPTGELNKETDKDKPDLPRINKILWDDAIIWPVTHYSSGLWARKGMFDFSQLNLNLPPTDISWIGVKQ